MCLLTLFSLSTGSLSISCFPPFQTFFPMSIWSCFVSVSLQCHRMWSVVIFTAQKGHSRLGSFSITADWVALVYPVCKRYDNLLSSSYRFGVCVHYVVWFALFHGCGRVFPFFLFFFYSCYQVLWGICFGVVSFFVQYFFCCDSEPIVMWYLWMLDRSVFGSINFLGSWIFFCGDCYYCAEWVGDNYSFLVATRSGVNCVYYGWLFSAVDRVLWELSSF
jgi:hypothetical protein